MRSGSRHILLTGATGFLGSHLALEFLKRDDAVLYCLARKKGEQSARQRIEKALETAWSDSGEAAPFGEFLASKRQTLIVWDCDLGNLADAPRPMPRLDEVCHLAAKVDFLEHRREETMRNNIGGTLSLLLLAEQTGAEVFDYFSTAFVSGRKSGPVVESDDLASQEANNPYEESKRAAEAEVLKWASVPGRIGRILRPSIVVGNSRTARADSPYGLYGFLGMMLRLRDDICSRMPEYFLHNPIRLKLEEHASLNLICVDHLVETYMRLRESRGASAGIFHICNPRALPLRELFVPASEYIGVEIDSEPTDSGLGPIDSLLNQHTRIFNCYLENIKTFSMAKTLAATGLDASYFAIHSGMQKELIRNYVEKHRNAQERRLRTVRPVVRALQRKVIIREDGQPLPYYCGGDGDRALVIINAYGQSLSFWDWVVDHFLASARIIVWQARGTTSGSGSGGLNLHYPVSVHVQDLGEILRNEGIESCDILGWCTGPKLSLEFYRAQPGKVRSMVFLTGAFKGHKGMESLSTQYETYMEPLCRLVAARPEMAGSLIEKLKSVLLGQSGKGPGDEQDESRRNIDNILGLVNKNLKPLVIEPFLTEQSVISYARQLIDFWEHDVSGILGAVDVPVLVIAGQHDNIASPEISRAVARLIPQATFLEILGGSHYPHFDNHELLDEILELFFRNPRQFDFIHESIKKDGPVRLMA